MEETFCCFCKKRFFTNGAGVYICPYCKKKLIVSKNNKAVPYEKRVTCPHCTGTNIVKDDGNYKCAFCRETFSLKDSKVLDSITCFPQALPKKGKIVSKGIANLDSPKNNGLAIFAFLLSISTIFMGWQILGIIGFILGIISITQIKKKWRKRLWFCYSSNYNRFYMGHSLVLC